MESKENTLPMIFVQKWYRGCPPDRMIGTVNCPAIPCGYLHRITEHGYIAEYPEGVEKSFPGIITPGIIALQHKRPCKVNLLVGKKLYVKIEPPIEQELPHIWGEPWKFEFIFKEKVK